MPIECTRWGTHWRQLANTIEPFDAALCQITLTTCYCYKILLLLLFLGPPFVERFALCCRTVVLSCHALSCPVSNGWMDQDTTWFGVRPKIPCNIISLFALPMVYISMGRPWSSPHCVRWGPASHGKEHSSPPHFSAYFALARPPISATAEPFLVSPTWFCGIPPVDVGFSKRRRL